MVTFTVLCQGRRHPATPRSSEGTSALMKGLTTQHVHENGCLSRVRRAAGVGAGVMHLRFFKSERADGGAVDMRHGHLHVFDVIVGHLRE